MSNSNLKIALATIRSSKWRSLLTMLGIIIGIVSVITTISLGEGVKRQVAGQINQLGKDLLIVRPGKPADAASGPLSNVSLFGGLGGSSLTERDLTTLKETAGVHTVVPLGVSNGIAEVEGRQMSGGAILATNEELPAVLRRKIEYGAFFTGGESNRHVAVIGKRVAEQLFLENVPVGRTLSVRGQEFIVRGVFEELEANPLTPGIDLNKAVFIPYPVAKSLSQGAVPVAQVFVKVQPDASAPSTIGSIRHRLKTAHDNQEDFTVLGQAESLAATAGIVILITQLVTGVAAISLMVGGIGIMNIMLVSVAERTHEIGIRKAIGATNRQILSQFLIEAAVLSFVGGLIGVALSIGVNFGIRIATDLHPVVTWPVVGTATAVSWLVGIIFGVMPAMRAARKDPIEALRYE